MLKKRIKLTCTSFFSLVGILLVCGQEKRFRQASFMGTSFHSHFELTNSNLHKSFRLIGPYNVSWQLQEDVYFIEDLSVEKFMLVPSLHLYLSAFLQ